MKHISRLFYVTQREEEIKNSKADGPIAGSSKGERRNIKRITRTRSQHQIVDCFTTTTASSRRRRRRRRRWRP